jgi:uncharacterized cupredoxin-like copper-binding protein/predicted methyltransferase
MPLSLFAVLFIGIVLSATAAAQAPHTHQHTFGDAEKWAQVFDDPKRDAWQKPHEVIQALALKPDAVIADIGSGTGYFAVRFARMVPKGKVYGVDTESDMVKYLAERAKREGLKNVIAVTGTPGDPRLPEKADLIILVDVYHHIEGREGYFRGLLDSLRPGGRVAIIDFTLDSPDGPPKRTRIPPERVKSELGRAGYRLAQEHGFLPNQYFLVFQPRKAAAHDTAPHHGAAHKASLSTQEHAFGRKGDAGKVSRTIKIDMADTMRYSPAEITVKRGETILVEAKNSGKVMHEIVFGTMQDLKRHGEHMKQHPAMPHHEPYMAHVAPGKTERIVWQFTNSGEFHYACLIPGHFEAGMAGKVIVK